MKNISKSTGRQPHRGLPAIEVCSGYDRVTLCQERDGEHHCVTVSIFMLPQIVGALVAAMRDTGAPPRFFARMAAEVEAAIPPEDVPAIRAARRPVISAH